MLSSRNTLRQAAAARPIANAVASAGPTREQGRDGVKALRVPRRQNHQRIGIVRFDLVKAVEQHLIFACESAAGHEDRPDLGALHGRRELRRQLRSRRRPSLQTSGSRQRGPRPAARQFAPAVARLLRSAPGTTPHSASLGQAAGETQVSRQANGRTPAHSPPRRRLPSCAPSAADWARIRSPPEPAIWAAMRGDTPDGEPEIKRKIEDVALAKALARQLLAGIGRRGNHNAPSRQVRLQLLHHARHRQHLAHRHRVDPDCLRRVRSNKPLRNDAQPLAPAGAILAVAQHLQQPPRCGQHEGQQKQRAVGEIHPAIVLAAAQVNQCSVVGRRPRKR